MCREQLHTVSKDAQSSDVQVFTLRDDVAVISSAFQSHEAEEQSLLWKWKN